MTHHTHHFGRILGIIALLFVLAYGIGTYHFSHNERFLPNTKVANIQIGNQSLSQAKKTINTHLLQKDFVIKEKGRTLTSFNLRSVNLKLNSLTPLKRILQNQNPFTWPLSFIHSAQTSHSSILNLSQNDQKLSQIVSKHVARLNRHRATGKGARLTVAAGHVKLVQASQGNRIDPKKLTQQLKKSLSLGQTALTLTSATYLSHHSSENTAAQRAATQATAILSEKAVYNIAGYHFRIPKKTIASWLTYQNQQLSLDPTQVQAYVSKLNAKYKTYGKPKTFTSTLRGKVTVNGGLFGWSFRITDETAALSAAILSGKDFTRQPLTQGTGYNTNKQILGNTYVEVDKKNQKMFIYKKGKLVLKTNVVTGLPPKQTTTTGVWSVWAKKRHATLRGKEADGSAYASKVSYWMPIDDTGIGIHDASWQPTFGGDWYKTHGSNGCVNTPPSVMPRVYKLVALGTPVIVF